MAALVRDHDWSSTPLGPTSAWPEALRTAVGICLNSSHPTAVYWGPELRLIYNDAWAPIPGERHPGALGRPAADVWSDIWHVVGPQFARVIETGEGFATIDQMLPMRRNGEEHETYWNYSFTPIMDQGGAIGGIFNQGDETSERVFAARKQAFLLRVGDRIRGAIAPERDPNDVLAATLEAIGEHLGAVRVGYCELDVGSDGCTVIEEWTRAGAEKLVGARYRFADYGDALFEATLSGQVVAVENVRTDPRLPSSAADAFLDLHMAAPVFVPIARHGRTFAILYLADDTPRRWRRDEIDSAHEAVDRMGLGYEQARATARLRESEGRFSAIFGQAAVGLAEMAPDGRFLRANGAMTRLLGLRPDGLRQTTVFDVTHPDDIEETRRRLDQAMQDGEPFQIEKRYLKPDGSYVWTIANVTRLVDERGRASGFLSVTADISERREAERVRALLLAELNHRVKNNLSTVQALARQTRRAAGGEASEFETAFDARLMALSRAHDLLMSETWSSASLAEIGGAVLAPYALEERTRIAISGPAVRLSPTAAVTMTMALHELATNAAKFGALSLGEGHVAIEWTIDSESRNLDFAWRETGGPFVAPPTRRGYGTRLIERGVVQELGGEARLEFAAEGVVCQFRVPLSQKVMAQ